MQQEKMAQQSTIMLSSVPQPTTGSQITVSINPTQQAIPTYSYMQPVMLAQPATTNYITQQAPQQQPQQVVQQVQPVQQPQQQQDNGTSQEDLYELLNELDAIKKKTDMMVEKRKKLCQEFGIEI